MNILIAKTFFFMAVFELDDLNKSLMDWIYAGNLEQIIVPFILQSQNEDLVCKNNIYLLYEHYNPGLVFWTIQNDIQSIHNNLIDFIMYLTWICYGHRVRWHDMFLQYSFNQFF